MKNSAKSFGRRSVRVSFLILSTAFCVCLVCSNLFVPRLWNIGILNLQMSGALLIFPISYIINDILVEVYGFKAARLVIWLGFLMCLFISLFSFLVTLLPSPVYEESRVIADQFDSIYSFVPRSVAGSLLAFVTGSMFNAFVMSKMKIACGGKHFWLRAIASSVVGEIVDSLVFFPIAYAGTLPFVGMLGLMCTETVAKTLYEILVLPLTILIVKKVKSYEDMDTYDEGISYNPFALTDL